MSAVDLPDLPAPSLDRRAATRATAMSVLVVVALLSVQSAVGALATSGTQPVAAVEEVPTRPDAAAWDRAASRTVSLNKQQMALPYGGGSTDEVTVKAVTNDTHVAFRLSWRDPTNDTSIAAPGSYSDAAAVMLRGGSQPPITMGAAGDPVNIWYWRASWQFSNHTGTGATTGDMYAYPHPDNETKPGLAAGNPLSQARYTRYGQNYYAKGYGSLSVAPKQNVDARGRRTDDGWQVTFVRPRSTDGKYDASFDASEMYLAFAVWNGSADEVNGQKSITLQYTTLADDGLSAASTGGSGSSGSSGASTAGGPGGGSTGGSDAGGALGLPSGLSRGLGAVLAAMVVAWLVTYRSIRKE
ncbi:MAG: ethylbenzene dehydrogenase-related protein [Haloferacaceae archaeon]